MRTRSLTLLVAVVLTESWCDAFGQINSFPHLQNFDNLATPQLPAGWFSTQNRTPGTNDFTTASGTARSEPNAVLSTNATVGQALTTAILDFSLYQTERLVFYSRRSGTHLAKVVVEASVDGGTTFPVLLGDTLRNTGTTNYVLYDFMLPDSLGFRSGVRIRWRVLPDASGATATFRLDDITIKARPAHDLALSGITSRPVHPLEDQSFEVIAHVANLGFQQQEGFAVDFYEDANHDSIPQAHEFLDSVLYDMPLAPDDSIPIGVNIAGRLPGPFGVIAVVRLSGDQNPKNNIRSAKLNVGYPPQSVVVNEIMYAPTSTEPEWVELYNARRDTVGLKNWLVSDINVATKRVITQEDLRLPPRGYAILTRDSAAFNDIHPGIGGLVIQVTGFPTLNNAGDAVVIYDERSATMDSVSYLPSWGGSSGGRSLERRASGGPSNSPANWGSSSHPRRSTPGRPNSISLKGYDLRMDTLHSTPPAPFIGNDVSLTAGVLNAGYRISDSMHVAFYKDLNNDSIPQPSELLHEVHLPPILPAQSVNAFHTVGNMVAGLHRFMAVVSSAIDEDSLNNMKLIEVAVGYPPGTIRMNEIMYAPSNEPEWVECINTATDTVDIRNWRVANRSPTSYVIISTSLPVPPSGLFLVTKDTALLRQRHPGLQGLALQVPNMPTFLFSNTGDAVVLMDNRGVRMDSVFYLPSWGGTGGRSLERIDPLTVSQDSSNWKTSTAPVGSTPLRKNTATRKDHDIAVTAIRFLPASPIVGDSVDVVASIQNNGLQPASLFALRFYEDINRDSVGQVNELLAELGVTAPLQPSDSLQLAIRVFVGTFEERRLIVYASYPLDEDTLNNIRHALLLPRFEPGSIRINEIMYAPQGGSPEWVEVMNVTADTVDMAGWRIGNRTSRYTVSAMPLRIPPSGFRVIAKDTALLRQAYPGVEPELAVQVPALPTFLWTNTGDAVVVADAAGYLMDSVMYAPQWGGSGGASLERIDLSLSSTDSGNWGSSRDPLGATPARQNSIVALDHDLKVAFAGEIVVAPGATVSLPVTVYNNGKQHGGPFTVRLYHDANRDSLTTTDEHIETRTVQAQIAPRDSLVVTFTWSPPVAGRVLMVAVLEYPPDLRPENNTAYGSVNIGHREQSVVINEIMYEPLTGQAEYVEFVNLSTGAVDLAGWTLTDRPTGGGSVNRFALAPSVLVLQSGEFFTLASDSSILSLFPQLGNGLLRILNRSDLSLNNDGDDLVLRDQTGRAIDSVAYSPSWHNPGVSDRKGRALEKINPSLPSNDRRSWSTAAISIGGTPGKHNSIHAASVPSGASLQCSPNPFSPDGDGFNDFTLIQYELPVEVSIISIKIFDAVGRVIRRLVNSEPAGVRGVAVWDGLDDGSQKARIGIYIVLLQAADAFGTEIYTAKSTVVLAGRLR